MLDSAFGFAKPEDSPGFLLWQTTVTWQRLIKKALDPYDLSHPQFVILAILLWFKEHNEEPTQIQIVRLSKLDKMTVSSSLKKLASRGLVGRLEHAVDTRAKTVHLTEQGKALTLKLVPLIENIDAEFFNPIGQANCQSLIQILSKLTKDAL